MTKHLAKGSPRHVRHISVIKSLDDLPVQKCQKPCCCHSDNDLYHCPLCPVDKFKATYHSRLVSHLKVHLGRSVKHKEWNIIPCSLRCDSKPNHLHCPFCTATGPNKIWLRTHSALCTEEGSSKSAANTAPENPAKKKLRQNLQKEDTGTKNLKAKRTSTASATTGRKTGLAAKKRTDEKASSIKQERNRTEQKIATEETVDTPRRSGRARKKNKKYETDNVFTPSKRIKKEPEDRGYSEAPVGQKAELSEVNDQPSPAKAIPAPPDSKNDAENVAAAAAVAGRTNPVPEKVRGRPPGSKCEGDAPLVNKILVKQLGKQMMPGQLGVPTSVLVPEAMFSLDDHTPEELARTVCEDHDVQYECYSQGVVLTGYWDQVSKAKAQLEELLQTLRLQPEGSEEISKHKELLPNHQSSEPSVIEPTDKDALGHLTEEEVYEPTAEEEPATSETVVEESFTTDSCPEEIVDATTAVKTELEVESEQPDCFETDAAEAKAEAEAEVKWEPVEADVPVVAEEENVIETEEAAPEETKDVSVLDEDRDGNSSVSGSARKPSMRFRNRALFRYPDRATHRCNVCGYRSTLEGVRKHKLRKHPKNGIKCDICEEEFGMRYDMRLHRLHHFKLDGHMTSETEQWVREHRPALVGIMLQDIEKEYSVKQGKLESAGEDSQGQTGDSQQEAGQNTAVSTPPAQTIDPKFLPSSISKPETKCVECHTQMSAENLVKHWQQEHCKYNLECSACGESFHKKRDWKQHSCQQPSRKTEDKGVQELTTQDEKQDSQLLLRCKLCRECCPTDAAIRYHFLSQHPVVFCCLLCGEQNSTGATFRRHYRQQHLQKLRKPPKEQNARFPCTRCEQSFSKQAYLTLHLKAHVAADAPPQQCDQCGFFAQKPGQLKAHILAKHSSGVVCDLCGQTFRTRTNLRLHKDSIHGESKPLSCPECTKVFSLARFLKVHIQRVHRKVRKHCCSICNRGFFEKIKMKEHEQTHLTGMDKEAVKRFECGTCGKRFMKKIQMQQHENIHLNYKPFSCSQCSKNFGTSAELRKHSFSHSDERPYRCVYCNKGFKFKAKLNAHTVIHTQKGGFTCEHCGHVFTARYTLRYHSCRAKDRPVQIEVCKLCSKQFASHHLLRYHTCTGQTQPPEDESNQLPSGSSRREGDQELLIQMCLECGQLFKEGSTHECGTQQDNSELVQGLAMEGVELRDFKKQNKIHLEVVPEGVQNQELGVVNADVTTADGGEIRWEIVDVEQEQTEPESTVDLQEEVQVQEGQADEVVYMCGVCNNLFPSQEEVQIHMAEHGVTAVMQTEDDDQNAEMSVTGTGDAEAELQVVEMEGTEARTLQAVIKTEELESVAEALADLQG